MLFYKLGKLEKKNNKQNNNKRSILYVLYKASNSLEQNGFINKDGD